MRLTFQWTDALSAQKDFNMLRKWAGLGLVLSAGLQGTASAQGVGKGAWEISGIGAWSYSDQSGEGLKTVTKQLSLSPALLAYPSRYLFLGPILDYTRVHTAIESNNGIPGSETLSTRWDLGLQTGLLANWSDARFCPLPYLGAAVGLSVLSLDIDEGGPFGEDSRFSDNGHFFAFFFGGKLRVSESFYLNVQPSLTLAFIGQKEMLGFRVGTGFSGTF
jgi:hypothetical protein